MSTKKKAPKVNVEKRRAEYEKFISTRDEEYDLWKDLAVQKSFLKELTTTTYDITENYERFFDKLFAFCQAFKTKMKTKEFKYEFFRSFFFGGVGVRKDDSTDVEKNYDGLTRYIIKEDNDAALKARRGFLDIYMALEEVNDLNEENFPDTKKKMKDALAAFIKHYEAHVKKNHKPIHEILADFLKVLRNVLTSNFHYSLFEFEHQDPAVRKVNDFKDAALLEKLCTDLQETFRILLMTNFIKDNPSLVVLTNKFKIPGWEQNKIQKHFIRPLYERWVNLRKEMNRLYAFGEDHWVVPIGENIDMVKLINELIEQEIISEKILGSDLKRDQLNFLFNTVLYIYNSPAREKLLADGPDNEIIIEYLIPKLTVLRYLDHIVKITKAKRTNVSKQARMQEYLSGYRSNQPEQEENKEQELKMMASTGEYRLRDIKVPYITALDDEDTPEELDKFGRYWIWVDYFPESMKDEIIRAAENLRNINVAVRQDLGDDYITTVLKAQPNIQKGGRSDLARRKKEKAEPAAPADLVRPPFIWNHTDVIEEEHHYRPHARPHDIYAGSRVKDMDSQVESLAYELRSFTGERWTELVKEVIGFFKANSTEAHQEILDVKLPQTF